MNREQIYNSAWAKAHAAADCAASVRMTPQLAGSVPAGVKDAEAYRNEVQRISAELTQAAVDQDFEAEGLRPS